MIGYETFSALLLQGLIVLYGKNKIKYPTHFGKPQILHFLPNLELVKGFWWLGNALPKFFNAMTIKCVITKL